MALWDERNAVFERSMLRKGCVSGRVGFYSRGSGSCVGADGMGHGSNGYDVQGVSGRKCILELVEGEAGSLAEMGLGSGLVVD